MNLDTLAPFIILAVGFFLGYVYREFILIRDLVQISKNINKMEQAAKEDTNLAVNKIIKLNHEIVNDTHYFYRIDDNSFVCQGTTLKDAAIHHTKSAGPDTLGWFVHSDTNEILCFANDECLEFTPDGI